MGDKVWGGRKNRWNSIRKHSNFYLLLSDMTPSGFLFLLLFLFRKPQAIQVVLAPKTLQGLWEACWFPLRPVLKNNPYGWRSRHHDGGLCSGKTDAGSAFQEKNEIEGMKSDKHWQKQDRYGVHYPHLIPHGDIELRGEKMLQKRK